MGVYLINIKHLTYTIWGNMKLLLLGKNEIGVYYAMWNSVI